MCSVVPLLIASTVVGVGGQLYQADAASKAAEYNAQVSLRNVEIANQNALIAKQRATEAVERGMREEEQAKRDATLERKAQEVTFSAANLDTGFGSPLDVIIGTAAANEMDAQITRENAEREARDLRLEEHNFKIQANNEFSNARNQQTAARNAKRGGLIGSLGTVLGGGAGILKFQAGTT